MGATIARIGLAHLRSSTRNLNRGWPLAWPTNGADTLAIRNLFHRFRRISSAKRVRSRCRNNIVSNFCMQHRYPSPYARTNSITCGVLRISNEIRRWILSNLYCFNWLGNLLYSQNVFRFDWIVDRFGILLRILLSFVAI